MVTHTHTQIQFLTMWSQSLDSRGSLKKTSVFKNSCPEEITSPIPLYQSSLDHLSATAKSLQSCPTLCDPIPGILQARTLEWVAISFSNAWKWKVKVKSLSHVRLFVTPWTAAYQAPPSMGFSKQELWSGLPLPLFIYLDHI